MSISINPYVRNYQTNFNGNLKFKARDFSTYKELPETTIDANDIKQITRTYSAIDGTYVYTENKNYRIDKPMDKFLIAYQAAMVAPKDTIIDIT
ncbi:MAG: hypothetical protein R3Y28_08050 [Candidatus Gastranaerophilales bacterium]